MKDRCGAMVLDSGGWHRHRCRRTVWKDGFCHQHHPENVEARRIKREKLWEEKRLATPLFQLERLKGKMQKLEKEVERHRKLLRTVYPLTVKFIKRDPDPGSCFVKMINWETERLIVSNGAVELFPEFSEVELYFGE